MENFTKRNAIQKYWSSQWTNCCLVHIINIDETEWW